MNVLGAVKALVAGLFVGFASLGAQIDFSHTITLGSVILAVLLIAVTGYFSIRNQQAKAASDAASTWRQEAEAREARAIRLEAELREKIGEYGLLEKTHERQIARILAEQQEIRHALKDEIATCRAQLKVEEAKHDLGAVIEQMNTLHHDAMAAMHGAQSEAVTSVATAIRELSEKVEGGQVELRGGQKETLGLLTEIRDALRPDGT